MSAPRGRVIVVGAGIAGLSTAWALNRRGYAVEVLEQGPIPNPRASSHDEHRITRYAYGAHVGYAYMMPAAFEAYERMFADIGARHYAPISVVYAMRGETGWHEPVSLSLAEMGKSLRALPRDELARRFPMLRAEGVTQAVETEGGMLFPIRILTDLTVALGARGVALHADTEVTEIDPEAGVVVAGGREHRADRVVVAAGAWVNRVTDRVSDAVVASRQAVIYLAPPPDLARTWAEAPVLVDLGRETLTYMLPPRFGTRLKIGDHLFTRAGDADEDRRAVDADLELVLRGARAVLTDFDRYRIIERKACYYTVTRDDSESFRVVPWGARGWVVSACSGHGFKLGPLIGEGVAAAIAGRIGEAALTAWAAGGLGLDDSRSLSREILADE